GFGWVGVAGACWKPRATRCPCKGSDGVVLQIGVNNRIWRRAAGLATNELITHKTQVRGVQHDDVRIRIDDVIAVDAGRLASPDVLRLVRVPLRLLARAT